MNDSKNQSEQLGHIDEQVIAQLADTAAAMTRILDHMSSRYDNHTRDLEYFRNDLAMVRDSIARIAKVLHEGNGEKPLISRVAVLETALTICQQDVDETEKRLLFRIRKLEEHEEVRTQAALEAVNIGKAGKWKLLAALATGLTGLVTSLVSLFGGG